MGTNVRPPVSERVEAVNAATHGVGIVASVAAGAVLITFTALRGDVWSVVGSSVFVATAVLLYTASTLYHAARSPRWKARLRVADHAAIYLLIAGTYTPFTLVGLRGPWGWTLFGLVWALAFAGVVFKLFMVDRFPLLSTVVYVVMGWMVLIAAVPMVHRLSPATLAWLFAGGVAYTAGTLFYHRERMPWAHPVWHLFVLAGSACHGMAVATNLLGMPSP